MLSDITCGTTPAANPAVSLNAPYGAPCFLTWDELDFVWYIPDLNAPYVLRAF